METPAWLVDGRETPLRCWTCDKKTHVMFSKDGEDIFSVCKTCNPECLLEPDTGGCEIICRVCFFQWGYNSELSRCVGCRKAICENCEGACYVDDETTKEAIEAEKNGECLFSCGAPGCPAQRKDE